MSRFGADYQVARPTGRCAETDEPLQPGTVCMATLCENPEEEGLIRKDFSLLAWEDGVRPDGLFSFWKSTIPEADDKRGALVDDDVLRDLFERLATDERPQRVAFRFVLGLILMRKRWFKFVGRIEAGTDNVEPERWLLKPKGSEPEDPPLEVINPKLTDEDVRELTDQLSEILQSEL